VRLAYVAATRARDLLVVPAIGDEVWEGGWFGPLNRALYPPVASRRNGRRGPQCPAFKSKDSVLERPNAETAGLRTVSPGEHVFADHGYSVVWWDPGALDLGAKPSFGMRREELIVKDVPRHVVADGRSRYDRWCLAREDARESGATPSMAVKTVREWTSEDDGVAASLMVKAAEVEMVDATPPHETDRTRPGGPSFGVLVHAVLAQAPFDATSSVLKDIAALEGRLMGVATDAAAAAARIAERVFAHDLLARARRASARGACRRESPVACVLPNGTLVEGIVDLAFEEDGRWTVVDYKTDRELAAAGEDRYRLQVALYASAIARATGRSVSGVLVRV
jgi:ATP-dependent exoDNAse (exonuclease V) beta subunit